MPNIRCLVYACVPGLTLLLTMVPIAAQAQQTFTQRVTKLNINCNAACSVIDLPALDNDPDAVVFVTPASAGASNPHPIGAYYMYLKKWSVFNLDASPIVDGATFSVEYYPKPDADHFVYVVPTDGRPCIDRAGLDASPNAQIRIFPTSSPRRGAVYNKGVIKVDYDPRVSKWCLANADATPVVAESAFSIAFTAGGGQVALTGAPIVPVATLAPAPQPPLTVVARAEWSIPVGATVGVSAQSCKLIPAAYANPAILATDTVIVTGQSAMDGENLRWSATIENGSVQLTACNGRFNQVPPGSQQATSNLSGFILLYGRKVNILVLR